MVPHYRRAVSELTKSQSATRRCGQVSGGLGANSSPVANFRYLGMIYGEPNRGNAFVQTLSSLKEYLHVDPELPIHAMIHPASNRLPCDSKWRRHAPWPHPLVLAQPPVSPKSFCYFSPEYLLLSPPRPGNDWGHLGLICMRKLCEITLNLGPSGFRACIKTMQEALTTALAENRQHKSS